MIQLKLLGRFFADICFHFPFNKMILLYHYRSKLVNGLQNLSFPLSSGGSSHQSLIKIVWMYTCKESTSEALFDMIDQTLSQFDISWKNCVAISLDNTVVNLGRKNSTMTRILNFNFAIYINECPCHVLHNIGSKALEKFTEVAGFDVEDVLVDIYLPIQW